MSDILIVDDDDAVRSLLFECLSSDYVCVTARSAEEAIDLLAAEVFKVVLTDIAMHGASGIELLASIEDLYPETVVVLISADAGVREAGAKGAFAYIQKPFDVALLTEVVTQAMSQWTIGAEKRCRNVDRLDHNIS